MGRDGKTPSLKFSGIIKDAAVSILHQKFVEKVTDPSVVIPVKTGIQKCLKTPGFRVALAIASLPGMTFELCCEPWLQKLLVVFTKCIAYG